jgi:hypothetical protein
MQPPWSHALLVRLRAGRLAAGTLREGALYSVNAILKTQDLLNIALRQKEHVGHSTSATVKPSYPLLPTV